MEKILEMKEITKSFPGVRALDGVSFDLNEAEIHEGKRGVSFAVWAPAADRVSVVGNFNDWNDAQHPMRPLGSSGVWELFVPGLRGGELYKYAIMR